jgi:small GTP-binding protein
LGEERLLTSDVPGTTRDSIDTYLKRGEREYLFIDTAGIRRKRSISMQVEKFSVVQSFRAIDRADVVLFMIEAVEGLADQDMRLINMTQEKGRAHILLINKWDAIEKDSKTADEWIKRLKDQLDYADYAPNLFISAKTGQRVHKIFELIDHVQDQWTRRLPTSKLNKWVADLTRRYSLPVYKRRQVKLYYMTQVSIRPPTFMVSSNHPDSVAPSYKRFLINRLREDFEFDATPLRIIFRQHGARGSATATPEDELEADELLLDPAALPALKAPKPLRVAAPKADELDDELDDELEVEDDELDSDDEDSSDDESSDDESSDDESSDDESSDDEEEGDEDGDEDGDEEEEGDEEGDEEEGDEDEEEGDEEDGEEPPAPSSEGASPKKPRSGR